MFKSIFSLEASMRKSLNSIAKNGDLSQLDVKLGNDTSYAIHLCIKNNYVSNLSEWIDGNGDYHFAMLGTLRVTDIGLKFIHDTSIFNRILAFMFRFMKGTLGFFLGVISTVLAEYIIWIITSAK
nr:MAG TPA: hypothetical protein [Caudoviricetes sp.]